MNKEQLKVLKDEGYMQQQDKEHFALRIMTDAGSLNAEQLRCVADIADLYGKGYIGLTTRQCVEIQWIKEEHIPLVRKRIEEAGIVSGGTGPRVVAISACKGSVCSYGLMDSQKIAQELNEKFFGLELAGKFKIGVVACPNNCVKAPLSDLGFMAQQEPKVNEDMCKGCSLCKRSCKDNAIEIVDKKAVIDYKKCLSCGQCIKVCPFKAMNIKNQGIAVYIGGKFGRSFRLGDRMDRLFEVHELEGVAEKVISYYKKNGKTGERLGNTIDRLGIDTVTQELFKEL